MSEQQIYFVGSAAEVAHHAAPLKERLPLTVAEPSRVVAQAKPGDLAIFYSEHFDRFRHACSQLKQRNVATLYMIDGILEWRNAWENRDEEPACPFTMRPVLSHKVACIGPSQARVLTCWGNAGKTEVVGIPRLDRLARRARKTATDKERFRILVMTAKCPGFTDTQVELIYESLRDVRDWIDSTPTIDGRNVDVIWRLTGQFDSRLGVENQLTELTGAELAQLLGQVDAVITTPSTAMLEAMLLDLPVAMLDYNNCPQYVTAAWQINSARHIAPVVRELASPPESKMLFQRTQMRDALYVPHSAASPTATDRLEQLAHAMLQAAATATPQTTLVFPHQILDSLPGTSNSDVGFDHRTLYPDCPEFSNGDLPDLQSQLGHARREIQHLQREMAQLQSELGEAHKIFEQIQQHPVAGPVVRIRQKLIDGLQAMNRRKRNIEKTSTNPIQ